MSLLSHKGYDVTPESLFRALQGRPFSPRASSSSPSSPASSSPTKTEKGRNASASSSFFSLFPFSLFSSSSPSPHKNTKATRKKRRRRDNEKEEEKQEEEGKKEKEEKQEEEKEEEEEEEKQEEKEEEEEKPEENEKEENTRYFSSSSPKHRNTKDHDHETPPFTPPSPFTPPPHAHLLLYLTGHGARGLLKFHDAREMPYAALAAEVHRLFLRVRFARLLVLAETCEGASLCAALHTPGVVCVAASDVGEPSRSWARDPRVGQPVVDRFARSTERGVGAGRAEREREKTEKGGGKEAGCGPPMLRRLMRHWREGRGEIRSTVRVYVSGREGEGEGGKVVKMYPVESFSGEEEEGLDGLLESIWDVEEETVSFPDLQDVE